MTKYRDEFETFDSIERLFQKLRNGEIEWEDGHYVIMSMQGEKYAVLPALEGWMQHWAELAEAHQVDYIDYPLRKLIKRLEYEMPLMPEDVEAAYRVVEAQRRMFRTLPRSVIAKAANKVQDEIRTDEIRDLMAGMVGHNTGGKRSDD